MRVILCVLTLVDGDHTIFIAHMHLHTHKHMCLCTHAHSSGWDIYIHTYIFIGLFCFATVGNFQLISQSKNKNMCSSRQYSRRRCPVLSAEQP